MMPTWYRQNAKEAMKGASNVKDENEKQGLVDLAFTWALAALMSDRVLGSSFVSSLYDVGDHKRQHRADGGSNDLYNNPITKMKTELRKPGALLPVHGPVGSLGAASYDRS